MGGDVDVGRDVAQNGRLGRLRWRRASQLVASQAKQSSNSAPQRVSPNSLGRFAVPTIGIDLGLRICRASARGSLIDRVFRQNSCRILWSHKTIKFWWAGERKQMTSLAVRTVPFRRRSLQQITTSAQFGGSAGGGFLLSNSAVSASAVPVRNAAAAKCRSASSRICNSTGSTPTILSMMAGAGARSGSGTCGQSRHLCRRSSSIIMGPLPGSASALSFASRSARIRPRNYGTTPVARQRQRQPPKQPGSQKRSQSTIIGVPGGPSAGAGNAGRGAANVGGAGGGAGRTGMLGGGSPHQQAAAQATWREIFHLLRERCNAFLLKPRRLPIPRWIAPKHYTVTFSECFGHSSFILVAASYSTDDFITLRSIAVIGSTAMLAFTYFHPHGQVLWLPFKWNVLFIAINSYRLGLIMYQQYLTDMMPEEMQRIREEHFYVVEPIGWSKLIRSGREETYQPGALIVQQGAMNRYIRLVLEGEVEVMRDGQVTYQLDEGYIVSESGLHAGIMLRGAVESCAAVVAKRDSRTPVRVLCWDRTELMDLLEKEKNIRSSLKAALSWDIIRKLKGQRLMLANGQVDNPALWSVKRKEQGSERYAAILANMLNHPNPHEHIDELTKYRAIHHIDDDQHRLALAKCGWTPEEFEVGRRFVADDDLDEEWDEEEEVPLGHELKRKAARLAKGLVR